MKPLHESKRRLAHLLAANERAELIHTFLTHTLNVLNQSEFIDRILVISSDRRVIDTAQRHGAKILVESAVYGLNPAVTHAVEFANDEGATAVLILPADLPFIESTDVAIMVKESQNNPGMVICSDDKGEGTNALFISPPVPFTFHYGPDSFRRHLQEANKRGFTTGIVQSANLQFDLDTEADWQKYQSNIHHSSFTIHHS